MLRLPRTKWSSLLPWKSKLFYHLSIKYIVCVETFPNLALNIASLNLGNYFAGSMVHLLTKSKLLSSMGFSINL